MWWSVALVLATVLTACGLARAAEPPLPAGFERGVNFAHIHRRGHGYGSERAGAALDELKAMGVDSVAITPFAYQRSADSDTLVGFADRPGDTGFFTGTDPTMTDDDFVAQVRQAKERGMRVVVKPHVWSRDFWGGEGEWHGTIRQADDASHARWWAGYRAFVLHYATLAAGAGADGFCLGTELVRMTAERPEAWRALAAEVRAVFPGEVTYAAHWHEELEKVAFWDALDSIGVCAYFPLDAPLGATSEELAAAWRPHLERVAAVQARYDKPVVFLEAGYRPVADTHREPWRHDGGEPGADAAARAYEAMFRAWSEHAWWRGVYLWKAFTDPARAHRRGNGTGFDVLGEGVAPTVRRWFVPPEGEPRAAGG